MKPNNSESMKDFMSRFMKDKDMITEYPDEKQRYAVAVKEWESKDKKASWISGITLSEGAEPKEEIMLFPYGKFNHPQYGELDFTDDFHNRVIKNFNDKVLPLQPFIDKEHKMGEALAWFNESPYYKKGIGTFIRPEWNELGKQLLSQKVYKYFSPWFEDYTDPQTGTTYKDVLRGGAATNIPFLKTMPPIVDEGGRQFSGKLPLRMMLSEIIMEGESDSHTGEHKLDEGSRQKSGTAGNVKNINKGVTMKPDVLKSLGLSETATAEEIEVKVKALSDEAAKLKEENNIFKKAAETKLSENKILADEIGKVKTQLLSEQADKVIGSAIGEGRLLPKDKDFYKGKFLSDPEGTQEFITRMPKVVNLAEKGMGTNESESDLDLMTVAKKLFSEKKTKNLSEAIKLAIKENPELGRDYESKFMSDPRRTRVF